MTTSSRFTYETIAYGTDAANNVVVDKTGLKWQRCAQGQVWSGSACTGTASIYTHEGSLGHAAIQNGWRLPNIKELASIADKGCENPAIDSTAFPNTPSNWFWSSSPYTGAAEYGYAYSVRFFNGSVFNNGRSDNYHVRLVRASQ